MNNESKQNDIRDIIVSKDSLNLLFSQKKPMSDKTLIKLLNNLIDEDKNIISISHILNYIKRNPSERKFNILSKYFDFEGYYDVLKAKLLITTFFSGKEKIFKRAFDSLYSEPVLSIFLDSIDDYFIIESDNNYNDITGNIKILMNSIEKEDIPVFNNALIQYIFNSKQDNINPLFSDNIQLSTHFKGIEEVNHFFKNLMYGKQSRSLHIAPQNNNIYTFLKKYNYFNHNDIHLYDQINILIYLLSKHHEPKEFINDLSKNVDIKNLFTDREKPAFEIMFKRLINKQISNYNNNSIKQFRKNIDALFIIMSYINNDDYLHFMKQLKYFDHALSNTSYINPVIRQYYDEKFIMSLNSHLNKDNHINIYTYQTMNNDRILELFEKIKEKESIMSTLPDSQEPTASCKKRL